MPFAIRLFKKHKTNMLHVILGAIALVWVGFQELSPSQEPPLLNIALPAALGVWLNDLAYRQRDRDRKIEHRVDQLESSDIGDRLHTLEESSTVSVKLPALANVIEVQERELTANRAALQLMREAVVLKEANDIPVLPETRVAITQLERQIELLALDILDRRMQLSEAAAAKDRGPHDNS